MILASFWLLRSVDNNYNNDNDNNNDNNNKKLGCDRLQNQLIYQFHLPCLGQLSKSVPVAKRSIFIRRGQVILLEFRHWQRLSTVQDGPPFLVCQHLLLEDPPFSSPKRPKN